MANGGGPGPTQMRKGRKAESEMRCGSEPDAIVREGEHNYSGGKALHRVGRGQGKDS